MAIEVPRVGDVDLVPDLRLLVEQLRHRVVVHRLAELVADLLEASEQRTRLGDALGDRLRVAHLGLLREVADARGEKEVQSRSRAEEAAGSVDVARVMRIALALEPPTVVETKGVAVSG